MARLGIGVVAVAALAVAASLCTAEAYSSAVGGYDLLTTAHLASSSSSPCDGELGQCSAADGEGLLRRSLAARKPTNRYVSYASLSANKVPCNKRGQSYYQNCASQKAANPYRRGCSAITRCSRNMN
ncbi:protein RALF-like 19 [Oryza brachyantha]|uniref:Uncharacterized protein n=1 Tax=Oryza brachyantha TaxID=4533 RepID=J3M4S5_ORYBR|nr:protein RALF-like 19 [Oryza brachyantha]